MTAPKLSCERCGAALPPTSLEARVCECGCPRTPRLVDGLEPPYYSVIFSSYSSGRAPDAYASTAARMLELAAQQEGYLGAESVREADGFGITVSYWRSLEAIAAWRAHVEHTSARERGRAEWYLGYELRVAKVERSYGFRARKQADE